MKIEDIIAPEPHCISPDATLVKAAEEMKSFDIGILPIRENDRLVGTGTIATSPSAPSPKAQILKTPESAT